MRAIFISYRREDAEGQAGRLFDDLVMNFGEGSVFMDVAGIELGRDFRRAIDEQVASCGVLLAVIGKGWLDAKDESGRRRLDDPLDFVRLETASALKRDIPVIPVLVRGASMPRAEQLPPDLAELVYRNAVELTHARWDSDLQVLVKALRPHVGLLQKDVGGARSEPAVGAPGKAWAAGTVGPSGEHGVGVTSPIATAQSAKKSWRLIGIAAVSAVIVVAVVGYLGYVKVAERARLDRVTEAEKVHNGTTSTMRENPNPSAASPSTLNPIAPNQNANATQPTIQTNQDQRRFSPAQCGSIKDTRTNLEWVVGPDRNITWHEARQWVTKLGACGGGWRMPTIEEIRSLHNPAVTAGTGFYMNGRYFPAHIDPAFNAIGGGSWVWSNESAGGHNARSFNLNQGKAVEYDVTNTDYATRAFAVRNVRK
jgi:hypothetical protein